MRITGGKFGGRIINVPKSDAVRPTQDRVREALFSMLMGVVPESDFLDLFAGSGAVGLEAVSRGARSVMFVERDARHLAELKKNASNLGVENASFVRADVYKWIEGYVGAGFDVAFADPPYALGEEKGYSEFLETLASRGVVRGGGFFVAEMTAVQKVQPPAGWTLVRDRTYGKTRVCLWRRDGNEENGDLKK